MAITMKELAELAGVSRPAVSAVLNNSLGSRVSVATRRRILQLARDHQYMPNRAAQILNHAPSGLIGLLSMSRRTGISAVLQTELIAALQREGYDILTHHVYGQEEELDRPLAEFMSRRVEGVVALNLQVPILAAGKSVPVVTCTNYTDVPFDIGVDRRAGGYQAARHLIDHGRRRLMYLSLRAGRFDIDKHAGVVQAMEEAGLEVTPETWLHGDTQDLRTITKQFVAGRVDAVVCANDHIATKLVIALEDAGIKVPDDIALTGFDGFAFCDFARVPIATVVQPIRQQAAATARLLLERIRGQASEVSPAKLYLSPTFRPSASCGCTGVTFDTLDDADLILLEDEG